VLFLKKLYISKLNSIDKDLFLFINNKLQSIEGLKALKYIRGELYIAGNIVLNSLSGLDNIDPASLAYLTIKNGSNLSHCAINSICDYMETVNKAHIEDNAEGCKTAFQIKSKCLTATENLMNEANEIAIVPNPTNGIFEIIIQEIFETTVKITDPVGSPIIKYVQNKNIFDLSDLSPGLYFITVLYQNKLITKKLILN
jgi:hypothetical protein